MQQQDFGPKEVVVGAAAAGMRCGMRRRRAAGRRTQSDVSLDTRHSIRRRLSWRSIDSRACSHYEIRPRGPPWWGLEAMPAPPGHRCDRTSLPARPQGATCTGQPAGCSRYTSVTLNQPLDFERGGQFFARNNPPCGD
jgi:hypothetical protein